MNERTGDVVMGSDASMIGLSHGASDNTRHQLWTRAPSAGRRFDLKHQGNADLRR